MKAPNLFILPLKWMGEERRTLEYDLGQDFFQLNENQLVGECKFHVVVEIEKKTDFFLLDFRHEGVIFTACDRCLENIRLPLRGSKSFILKLVDEAVEDEEEVIYAQKDADHYDIAGLINEVITLSVPLVKKYDCEKDEKAPCNPEVLRYLQNNIDPGEVPPVWEKLKDLRLEDN